LIKVGICPKCKVKLYDLGLNTFTIWEFVTWVLMEDIETLKEGLRRLDFHFCECTNEIDNIVKFR
jgi:hypothetical protein